MTVEAARRHGVQVECSNYDLSDDHKTVFIVVPSSCVQWMKLRVDIEAKFDKKLKKRLTFIADCQQCHSCALLFGNWLLPTVINSPGSRILTSQTRVTRCRQRDTDRTEPGCLKTYCNRVMEGLWKRGGGDRSYITGLYLPERFRTFCSVEQDKCLRKYGLAQSYPFC
jgi:hypothetical protein